MNAIESIGTRCIDFMAYGEESTIGIDGNARLTAAVAMLNDFDPGQRRNRPDAFAKETRVRG